MATFNKFDSFVEALAEKIHDLGVDQLGVALTNTIPNVGDTQLSDITEITYTGLSSRNITTTTSAQTGGTYKLVLADLQLDATQSVGPFRYIVITNTAATNGELIGWYDYGSSITLENGESFTVDFDPTNGVLQIA